MRPRSLADVARAVDGSLAPGSPHEALVSGVAVDSRVVSPGDLFVALEGDRVDGHRFVADALRRGAAAALVRAGRGEVGGARAPAVVVAEPARALLALARAERSGPGAGLTVVGITGSTGKTCTKDLTAAVVARAHPVVASESSFNNEIGLPLSILRATAETRVLILEMGSRGPGHIRLLCDVARPDIGVVTNVGVAHMELFGSPEVLRDAKAELPEALPAGGTAILNADDETARAYAARTPARALLYGTTPDAEVRGVRVEVDRESGRASFELATPLGTAMVTLPAPGEHLVMDALAAAAVGLALGLGPADLAAGLGAARITPGRMEALVAPDGLRVIDDAYNANPASVAAALKALKWMAGAGRCVAVLGPMAELGPISDREHERVGELVARLGIDALVTVGSEADRIALGAEREGVEPRRIVRVAGVEEALEAVRRLTRGGDVVLVKASRVSRLERLAAALAGRPGPGGRRPASPTARSGAA